MHFRIEGEFCGKLQQSNSESKGPLDSFGVSNSFGLVLYHSNVI